MAASDPLIDPSNPAYFELRQTGPDEPREGDVRGPFQRDRARIIHSAAFRRLQAKTQVMGVGEGDFHRTRLTHSIECAQLGNGLLQQLAKMPSGVPAEFAKWMPDRDLIEAACFAHDLGHPPFGHGGEKALHGHMRSDGGFEGNGQTLRIITRLEKYRTQGIGIDPTRRLILAILKYPRPHSDFPLKGHENEPPKCYFDEEKPVVEWATRGFSDSDRKLLPELDEKGKPKHRTFDASLMELADDIAYGVHDIEDIVARRMVSRADLDEAFDEAFRCAGGSLTMGNETVRANELTEALFADSYSRKQGVSLLVNVFMTAVRFEVEEGFEHALLRYRATLERPHRDVLTSLRKVALRLVVSRANVQQLERRGQRVVGRLFGALSEDPKKLIPKASWEDGEKVASAARRVCDYVAGMTDSYAEMVYRRLFVPGFGSSADEL